MAVLTVGRRSSPWSACSGRALPRPRPRRARRRARRPRWALIAQHPYLRNLALLVALCALTEAVLDYVLSATVVRLRPPAAPLIVVLRALPHRVGVLALARAGRGRAVRALQRLGLGGTLAVPPAVVAAGAVAAASSPGVPAGVALRAACRPC